MKINIVKKKKSTVQEFFSKPLNFKQRVEVKKLQIAGMICKVMEKRGLNRTKLAEKMGIKPSRVTAMLDGTQNLTIETIMRASEALEQKLECTLVAKEHAVRWISYDTSSQNEVFEVVSNVTTHEEPVVAPFIFDTGIADDDYSLAS
jgi:plasmid maintenance system antidote protein VapI